MWSSSARATAAGDAPRRRAALRIALAALALAAPLVLTACSSFRPVYGTGGVTTQRLELAYAKPNSRLEQIIIQDLSLRLGSTTDPDAPRVRISAAAGARALTRTSVVKPATQYEMAVSATYSVTLNGKVLVDGTRRATASYTTVGQVLADEAAAKDATERAGHEVAETIRLSILAALAAPVRESADAQ